jgi:hypothetical protein
MQIIFANVFPTWLAMPMAIIHVQVHIRKVKTIQHLPTSAIISENNFVHLAMQCQCRSDQHVERLVKDFRGKNNHNDCDVKFL